MSRYFEEASEAARAIEAARVSSDLVRRMAATLVQDEATASDSDAIRCLIARGFRYGDIAVLYEDALFAARQQLVTRQMTVQP